MEQQSEWLRAKLEQFVDRTGYVLPEELNSSWISFQRQGQQQRSSEEATVLSHLSRVWNHLASSKFQKKVELWDIVAISALAHLLNPKPNSYASAEKDSFGKSLFYYVVWLSSECAVLEAIIPFMIATGCSPFESCFLDETPFSAAISEKNYAALDILLLPEYSSHCVDNTKVSRATYWKKLASYLGKAVQEWNGAGLSCRARAKCYEYAIDIYEELREIMDEEGDCDEFIAKIKTETQEAPSQPPGGKFISKHNLSFTGVGQCVGANQALASSRLQAA